MNDVLVLRSVFGNKEGILQLSIVVFESRIVALRIRRGSVKLYLEVAVIHANEGFSRPFHHSSIDTLNDTLNEMPAEEGIQNDETGNHNDTYDKNRIHGFYKRDVYNLVVEKK